MKTLYLCLSNSGYRKLKRWAKFEGKTLSRVVHEALSLRQLQFDLRRSGGRMLIEKDGAVRELTWEEVPDEDMDYHV